MICCEASKILRFIKRLAHDFKHDMFLKTLHYTFLRPILEYGDILLIRKFLSFANFILHIQHLPHVYSPLSNPTEH